MKYTQGRKGPVSRTRLTILSAEHANAGPAGMAQGNAIAHLSSGMRDVRFLVQGKHYEALRERLRRDGEIQAMVRWTGRHALTVVEACALQPEA